MQQWHHLYGCDGSSMSLKNGNGRAGTQAPHSDDFVTACRCNETIFIVHSHVTDLRRVAAERGKESTIVCGPDFYQAVIRTLNQDEKHRF